MVIFGIIGITTVIFGIASLLLISKARRRLSDGSIKEYMANFSLCLAFIVIFSIWQTIRGLFNFPVNFDSVLAYPEYIFLIFAYVAFIITSYRISKISEEFSFKDDGRRIGEILSKTKAKGKKVKRKK